MIPLQKIIPFILFCSCWQLPLTAQGNRDSQREAAEVKQKKVKTTLLLGEKFDTTASPGARPLSTDTINLCAYDRQGNLIKKEEWSLGKKSSVWWRFYNLNGQEIRSVFILCRNAPGDSSLEAMIDLISYNPSGQKTRVDYYDRKNGSDSLTSFTTFDYTTDGVLKEEKRYWMHGEQAVMSEKLVYHISENGHKQVIIHYNGYANNNDRTDTIITDQFGNLLYMVTYAYGNYMVDNKIYYYPDGKETYHCEQSLTLDGYPLCIKKWSFDIYTNVQHDDPEFCNDILTIKRKKGKIAELIGKRGTTKYLYNKKGRLVVAQHFTSTGKVEWETRIIETYY